MNFFERHIAYLKDNPEGYWFKAKLYGWGWTPVTWQGWLIIAAYVFAVLGFTLTIDTNSPPREVFFTFLIPVTLLTVVLIRVCYRTGEKPHWMWGPPDKYK